MQKFHERLAELRSKERSGMKLSNEELKEKNDCLDENEEWVSELNRLENWADAFASINDKNSEAKVCQLMDYMIYDHQRNEL
ncbi:hypothetical protein IC620_15935 [Hazenella sp. IB182357]|uniref:Uncharacterized protein n=1 Tax=Polycladospora coralii TaxID=2771432 RepID=A0A926NEB0_9BACL|nr:hypothetical protein [Polycladospora coralii]MBD1373835.1 hypothetical protein [Polycladospora coralii]